ncbi:AHH domain-containing protein [Burkholderia cepacia]|uniref:AHH domain-containing protein n=1 Tax=Burkholderia cepacia TaxID=292 RepID=UPI0009C0958F|nr:AHH domain-containing protein [Burkholderia cepacia]
MARGQGRAVSNRHVLIARVRERSRQQMEDLGIPLNGAKNGAWLPKDANSRLTGDLSTAHSGEGVHSDAYKQYVFDNLINAKTKPEFIAGLDDFKSDLKGEKTFPTKR